jgi:UDP-N-acetylmuramate--alanine ligase
MTHIHLIGIGGSGISSIARILLERGYTVSGSDRILSPLALDLRTAGVTIYEGHEPSNIDGADVIVRSSAIPDENVEVQSALLRNIPVYKRSDFLGSIMSGDFGIAIAGSHGKTTTSALMAWVLYSLELDPSFILGGVSKNLKTNAHAGKGHYFVVEADEYDRMFLGLNPNVIIVTNIEYDHPDCFPTVPDYEKAFHEFINRLTPQGFLIANFNDAARLNLFADMRPTNRGYSYGFEQKAEYQARNLTSNSKGGFDFDFVFGNEKNASKKVKLQISGKHNVLNALGVLAVVHQLGLDLDCAIEALSSFSGTGRRFDVIGEVNGITIVDDYAHHPAKIRATLAAARARYPGRRIIAVWQPHTYSRTKALQTEFANAFIDADMVIASEIYASREKVEEYSSKAVVKKINNTEAKYLATLPEISDFLLSNLKFGDVVIVLSAGDADQICRTVFSSLSERKN